MGRLGRRAERRAVAGIALHGALELAEGVALQFLRALLQGHHQPLVHRRQLAPRQEARALRAQDAELLAQHRGVYQGGLDQRVGVLRLFELQAVGIEQLLADAHDRGNQRRVLRRALRLLYLALVHAGLQRLPGLARLLPGGELRGGDLGLGQAGAGGLHGLVHQVARGGAARRQGRIAPEHAGGQAAVHLHALHHQAQRSQRSGPAGFQARAFHGVQRVAHVQERGQHTHEHANEGQNGEFLQQADSGKQGHNGECAVTHAKRG